MFWLAVLLLAAIGLNAPRKWLARGLRGATESTLKFLMFLGAACLILFGLISIAPHLDFFTALLPACGLWLGVFAVFELGRRRTIETDLPLEPAPREQQPDAATTWQPQPGQTTRQSAFEQDPWAVLARRQQAEKRALAAGEQPELPGLPAAVWPLANLLAKPNGKAQPEREDAGMVVFAPEDLAAAANPAQAAAEPAVQQSAAKSALLNVLNVHIAVPEPPAADSAAPSAVDDADTATPEAQSSAPAPLPASAYASTAPTKSEVSPQLKPADTTPPQAAGKYKYEPKLVKSLFGKDAAK